MRQNSSKFTFTGELKAHLRRKQSLDCSVIQMKSVISQPIVSAELGLTAEGVVLMHSTVVADVGQVDLSLDLVGSLAEVQIVGAVVAAVHKPVT